jgi:mediator of RNA polymerase II transcription subunit 12
LAATTIEVQFSLKQMGERLALGTPNRNTKVDRLIAKFMHHHMSTEEADLVAEMVRGVGPTIACKVVISASNSACGGANLMSSS